jgi:hypothetical protein
MNKKKRKYNGRTITAKLVTIREVNKNEKRKH